ncbi:integrase arm-type DNA-binding domain-containing protein [Burkholderia multivorans]|uniref:tyrosine-type recombinase/integrase n=2 Tax=Burkholderia multivorans TaxID=87883 RepID=UPI0009E0C978|nr:integrase arm-type DNA-binding domain-containing protein [Burkholderia multivorans]MCA8503725.1 integrase arm-type DNA-binding domain-containing protein [Burkholderia multivorans]MDN8082586.1 integrase arm-type DNA-binding domain-containing protein [Burkholderia multivorans]SAK29160.1 integrase [Burkholderia multivorans]SAK33568.1 integrase [Burkholderia multivorans]
MPESLLRDLQCRAAKPRERVYRLNDGGGLAMLVKPNGLKYWQFRYMKPDGREGLIQIGPYPRITLEAARAARNEHRLAVQRGDDPATLRKQEKARRKVDAVRTLTFKQCAAAYIDARSAEWVNPKHTQQWTNTLATYAYPIIGTLRPADIDTDLVRRVLEPIWLTKNETASRLRGRIENVLDWAKVRGLRDGENPARWSGHLDQLLAAPTKVQKPKHHTALPYTEIGPFVAELRGMVGTAARALEFTILTAMRTGEVIGALPNEIDMDAQLWTVPAERMKAKRPHRVPLSSSAMALLNTISASEHGPLFEGVRARRPLSNMAMLKVLERMGRLQLTVHGFRSTFRDWAAECTPYPNEVVEMALAHTIRDKTEAAYRRGDLFEKRRKLMQTWADYIEQHQSNTPRAMFRMPQDELTLADE